jgi:hypothetical protein
VPFTCPGCAAPIDGSPGRLAMRCPSCGALLHGRRAESSGPAPVFEVEVAGRPQTRRRVEVPWDAAQHRRLTVWLAAFTALSLVMAVVLYALARWLR